MRVRTLLPALAIGISTATFLGHSSLAVADTVGVSAGLISWNADYSGDVSSGGESVDVDSDLGLDSDYFTQAFLQFEHPVPLLPNVRIQYTQLDQSGDGRLTSTFDNVPVGAPVHTDLDLTHTDLVLYYEVLDNLISLDLGVDVKFFDGELRVVNRLLPANKSETNIDQIVPMIYVAPGVNILDTGLSVGAELSAIGYSGNRLLDATIRAKFIYKVVGVEAGWRQMNIKLDDVDDIDADVKIGGPYLTFILAI